MNKKFRLLNKALKPFSLPNLSISFSPSIYPLTSLISLFFSPSIPHPSLITSHYSYLQNLATDYYGGYTERELKPCCRQLAIIVKGMHSSRQQAVKDKYSNRKFLSIAKEPALSGSIIQELAAQKNVG